MGAKFLVICSLLLVLIDKALSLQCYRCHSSQPGCGKELNIRLQKWHSCPNPGDGGGENFCVKVIETRGSEVSILRECLMTLRHNTGHREKIPMIQRHGYCEPARVNDPDPEKRVDETTKYCFCNDWNGCNTASGLKGRLFGAAFLPLLAALLTRWL